MSVLSSKISGEDNVVEDEGKRFGEALCMAYARELNTQIRIVRIFNTYGERMRIEDGRAIPAFISQALRDEPLPVFGDGSQTRSFCHVSDLVRGLASLLMSELNEPVNIGNPNEMTILQLANVILEMTQSKSKIDYKPLPVDDPKVRQPDITQARTKLSWEPKVALRDGLVKTIDYFKANINTRGDRSAL